MKCLWEYHGSFKSDWKLSDEVWQVLQRLQSQMFPFQCQIQNLFVKAIQGHSLINQLQHPPSRNRFIHLGCKILHRRLLFWNESILLKSPSWKVSLHKHGSLIRDLFEFLLLVRCNFGQNYAKNLIIKAV